MWYTKVSKDISYIPDAVAYFNDELTAARTDAQIKGNIEKAAASMPGIVEMRFSQLQEIEAILEYLNIELRRL
jgi:cbb3-type cytochrome oxidase cytochrome c subunit